MNFLTKLFKKKPVVEIPLRGIVGKSVFENLDELLNALKAEPEYKQYF